MELYILAQQHSIVIIHNSTFTNSSATWYGGAILSLWSNITFTESKFDINTAGEGGAVFSTDSNITIKTSEFDSNSVERKGGVLALAIA